METKRAFLKKLGLLTVGGMVAGTMSPAIASESKRQYGCKEKEHRITAVLVG
jgi:hypothetical protein